MAKKVNTPKKDSKLLYVCAALFFIVFVTASFFLLQIVDIFPCKVRSLSMMQQNLQSFDAYCHSPIFTGLSGAEVIYSPGAYALYLFILLGIPLILSALIVFLGKMIKRTFKVI
jgi:hypothetical protein